MQFIKKHPVLTAVVVATTLLLILIITSYIEQHDRSRGCRRDRRFHSRGRGFRRHGGIGDWFLGLFRQSKLQQENAELKEQIAQLEGELALNGDL